MISRSLIRAGLLLGALLLVPALGAAQGVFGALEQPAPEAGTRRAILIGINRYQDAAFPSLSFARADAEDLGAALRDSRFGDFGTVTLVVDGDLSARGIVSRLKAWAKLLAPEDLAMVYFSGHGARWLDERTRSQVFLAASDTKMSDPVNTGIPLEAIQDFLQTLPAQKRVLVVDACFTGQGKVSADDAEAAAKALVDEELPFSERASEKEAQLFATTYGRPALEQRSLGHSVYTYHLIQALSERFDEADVDHDQVVSVSEAHDYARDHTMTATAELQVPMVWYKVIGREELLLSGDPNSRSRVQLAMLTAYDAPQEGMRLFVDGVEKGAFPRSVLIEPGSHAIEFRNLAGKRVDSGRMTFRKEQVYSVGRVRNTLNGGLHQISVGFTNVWMPTENRSSLGKWPSAPGFRIAWVGRARTRSPLLRRLGISADFTYNQFRVERSFLPGSEPGDPSSGAERVYAPKTSMLEIGFGPFFRVDVPFVLLQLQPRVSLVNLLRHDPGLYEFDDSDGSQLSVELSDSTAVPPFKSWIFGAVGVDLAIGVRPVNRLSVQLHYAPMVFNAALAGEVRTEFFQRLAVTVEIGL